MTARSSWGSVPRSTFWRAVRRPPLGTMGVWLWVSRVGRTNGERMKRIGVAAACALFFGLGGVGSAQTAGPVPPAPYEFSITLVNQSGRNPYGIPDGTVRVTDRAYGSGDTGVYILLALAFIPESRYLARLVDGSCADALRAPVRQRLADVHMGRSSTVLRHVSAVA